MKRLYVLIDGKPATSKDILEIDQLANREFSAAGRKPKVATNRKHRALTAEAREAKRQRTEINKAIRKAERAAKEHERFMRRLAWITRKQEREDERRRQIVVTYKIGREPKFKTVCPRALFRRAHALAPTLLKTSAKTASDGFRNLVFRRNSRGFGTKKCGREYKVGEASRCARYIARPDGLEQTSEAVFTNLLGTGLVALSQLSIEEQQEVAGFFDALENIERATVLSHVYSHGILALPYEIGDKGRSAVVREICAEYTRLGLPFIAAMHKPDREGNQRNYHLHIVAGTRPFERLGEYSWAFGAEQYSEFISVAGMKWTRNLCVEAFNNALAAAGSDIRYSALSQAVRGLEATTESHKGQKQVAMERAAEADDKKADEIFAALAQHALAFHERLRDLRLRRERERERQKRAAGPVISAGQPGVSSPEPAVDPKVSNVAAERALVQERTRLIGLSQIRMHRPDMTDNVQSLIGAIQRHPQEVAIAIHNNDVRIAYRDQSLERAIRDAHQSPRVLDWLRHLAEHITFEHAAVPPTWHEMSLVPGSMLFPTRASYWAMTHGGVVADSADRSQSQPVERGRGR